MTSCMAVHVYVCVCVVCVLCMCSVCVVSVQWRRKQIYIGQAKLYHLSRLSVVFINKLCTSIELLIDQARILNTHIGLVVVVEEAGSGKRRHSAHTQLCCYH